MFDVIAFLVTLGLVLIFYPEMLLLAIIGSVLFGLKYSTNDLFSIYEYWAICIVVWLTVCLAKIFFYKFYKRDMIDIKKIFKNSKTSKEVSIIAMIVGAIYWWVL